MSRKIQGGAAIPVVLVNPSTGEILGDAANPLAIVNLNASGAFAVPAVNTANNVLWGDVIGNKLDTVAGDSLVALVKQTLVDTNELSGVATNGLLSVSNSLDYRIAEIERHLHSGGRWLQLAGTPTATHKADRIGVVGGGGPFRIDAGNNTWGDWVQILGSDDTPVEPGKLFFDPHELVMQDSERAATYFIQIGRGASGAAALAAGTYAELVFANASNKNTAQIKVQTGRAPAGSLLWARCMVPAVDTGWFDFFYGIHEYEG